MATITLDTLTGSPKTRTDLIGDEHIPKNKLTFGADGVATDVSTTNGYPVQVVSEVPGTGPTNLGKAVDSAAGGTDTGVAMLAVRTTTPGTVTPANGDYVPLRTDDQGNLRVNLTAGGAATQVDDAPFTAGTSEVLVVGFVADETSTDLVDEGDQGAARMTRDRKVIVSTYAHSSGGWDVHRVLSAASTNTAAIKTAPGVVNSIVATNTASSVRYLKLYNQTSAPTLASDTPVATFMIPASSNGFVITGLNYEFSTGIARAITTGVADTDTGATAANEVIVNIGYK